MLELERGVGMPVEGGFERELILKVNGVMWMNCESECISEVWISKYEDSEFR